MVTKKRTTRTAAEMRAQLRAAQEAHRARLAAEGVVPVQIRIHKDRRDALKALAAEKGIDLSELISDAIKKMYKI